MPDVLIRGLSAHVHATLKSRAGADGLSLQAYISQLLVEHTARPTMKEWLAATRDTPIERPGGGMSGREAVLLARAEDEARLEERLGVGEDR